MLLDHIAFNAIINASIVLSWFNSGWQHSRYISKTCEPVKHHSLNVKFFGCFETMAS